MKKFVIPALLFAPIIAFAQSGMLTFIDSLINIVAFIIPLLISFGILVFFWGIVKFIAHAEDEKAREGGKQVIIWGLVAIFVMVALWSIVGYVQSLLNLSFGGPGDLVVPPTKVP